LDGSKYSLAQMIGNALPPEFIRRHAKELKRELMSACNKGSV